MLKDFKPDLEKCLETLAHNGIILYPTDTIWGLGCDATNEKAVERIIQLKRRPAEKSFVVLVATENDILKYTASPDMEVFNFLEMQDRPVTVIYQHAIGIAENAIAINGSVAIRICKDPFCKALIRRFGKPLLSTSANFSGEKAPAIFPEINHQIMEGVDYTVQYRQDDLKPAQASMIIQWEQGTAKIIRN
ncbi:MAG: threonylcarbamoyl-AMP synthase [Bacteroidetes bacterium]|nr:threonylcarbamoyl-AMP synthase [Bacteroidota bacterium]